MTVHGPNMPILKSARIMHTRTCVYFPIFKAVDIQKKLFMGTLST